MNIIKLLADEFSINENHVENIIKLIDDGNTIPFIARYRKELTGGVDDQILRSVFDRLNYIRALESRKNEVIQSIEAQGKLTDEIRAAAMTAKTLAEVEDIYRPYRPKRRTRASIAREKGLEPLAQIILSDQSSGDIEKVALAFIDAKKGVNDCNEAIDGAIDIIAEDISDNAVLRKGLRQYLWMNSVIWSSAKNDEQTVYSSYNNYREPVCKIPSHRVLAINRGEKEDVLKVELEADQDIPIAMACRYFAKPSKPYRDLISRACADAYKRLIFPSLEREIRSSLTETASEGAISLFAVNTKNLLMQPPIKGKIVMGLDPAFRTGCKVAVVDQTGKLLDNGVIYPTPPHSEIELSRQKLLKLIEKYGVEAIAIGNGTASRETESFVAAFIKEASLKISYMIVSEAGASVYSASKLAAEEFPGYDVSQRSAVSIARRMQDPLAELVKIDPKAIGVGQYQHDMPPQRLNEAITAVVEDCVNSVGVDVNTASYSLLSYVSGINSSVAKKVVSFREENGPFKSRKELMSVPKLGKKVFEQCAGFLRIPEGKNILDNTGVHPESYKAATGLLEICGYKQNDILSGLTGIEERAKGIGLQDIAKKLEIGLPTLCDIIGEIKKPGRDPRDELMPPILRDDVLSIKDLKEGMVLLGTVRNVTDFGAFVDIGVHEDGLVHISQISSTFIKHPSEVLGVGDIVKVMVIAIDLQKNRISLSIKQAKDGTPN